MLSNTNGFATPGPLPPEPPYRDSIYNVLVRRIRAAGTMFGDRVKLVLRQDDSEWWSLLDRPYLLVIPTQTSAPRKLDQSTDVLSFVNPRQATLVAQFDDCNSEASYQAMNMIDTAENQLIRALANWKPQTIDASYEPTLYGGMRIQTTRAPDVKVNYSFTMYEKKALPESPSEDDYPDLPPMQAQFGIHVTDPCCDLPCELIPPLTAEFLITGGRWHQEEDPCPPDPCLPIFGGDPHANQSP